MIGYLKGSVVDEEGGIIIVNVGGIGYKVYSTLKGVNRESNVSLYIYTHVREDQITLFGFASKLELQIFKKVISISGVGPKIGLAIFDTLGSSEFLLAINQKDVKTISSVPGVGKKLAERLVLELEGYVKKYMKANGLDMANCIKSDDDESRIVQDATEAVVALGYDKADVLAIIRKIDIAHKSDMNKLFKEILSNLSN